MGFALKVSGMLVLLVAIFVVEQSAQPHDHEFDGEEHEENIGSPLCHDLRDSLCTVAPLCAHMSGYKICDHSVPCMRSSDFVCCCKLNPVAPSHLESGGISGTFYLSATQEKPRGSTWFAKVSMGKRNISKVMNEIKAVAGIN